MVQDIMLFIDKSWHKQETATVKGKDKIMSKYIII